MLGLTGGAIEQVLPTVLDDAALACADRRIIVFQADRGGLYTAQALWSMVRDNADVTVVVCANCRYRILQTEPARAGIPREPWPKALAVNDFRQLGIDWVALVRGLRCAGLQGGQGRRSCKCTQTRTCEG